MPFNGVNGPVPSYVDYSTGRCAPNSQQSAVVPNPGAYPYGVGIPNPAAQQPAAAPIAAGIDGAKQNFGQRGGAAPAYAQAPVAAPVQAPIAPVGAAPPTQAVAAHQSNRTMESVLNDLLRGREQAKLVASPEDIEAFQRMHDRTHTRSFFVEWKFSLEQAAVQPQVLTKKVTQGDILRFSVKDPVTGQKTRIGDLKTGIILSMSITSAFSDAKPSLGLKIPGVPGRVYTLGGRRYPFVISYKQSLEFKKGGRPIHQISEMLNTRRLERFGHLTEEAIEKTIRPIADFDFSFITCSSPVVHVIKINQDILRINLDEQPAVDGNWYLIANNIIQAAKALLKRDFFDRMPFQDLSGLSFTLERTDGQPINDPAGLDAVNARTAGVSNHFVSKQNTIRMQIDVTWMLPNVVKHRHVPVTAASAAPVGQTAQPAGF